jgi:diaminopimelate decarboxylase
VTVSRQLLEKVVRRYGTPLYVYDFDELGRQLARMRRALLPWFEIAYAVKANPSLGVLAFLARRGLSADIASRGELSAAVAAGFDPGSLLVAGPAKTDTDLEAYVRSGVGQIHAEGPQELARLERIGARLGKRISVGLRLNPPWGIEETRPIIGGAGAKKFGFDLASARKTLRERHRLPHVRVRGFHVFNASNVLDARLLVENTRRVLDLSLALARRFDVPLEVLDFGGGFGVPYADRERPLNLEILRRGLSRVARFAQGEPRLHGCRLIFEPGRFLVAGSGSYLATVVETKRSRGVEYVFVDGGIHHFLRPALLGTPNRVEALRPRRGAEKPVVVAGPLCTSLDVLHQRAVLPHVEPGDLLRFENAGAYGYTESMPLFLSHQWPAEVAVSRGRAALLRRPPSVSELIGSQRRVF